MVGVFKIIDGFVWVRNVFGLTAENSVFFYPKIQVITVASTKFPNAEAGHLQQMNPWKLQ